MLVRRLQVLPDGQDVATRLAQVAHQFLHLFRGLPQPYHDARFGGNAALRDLSQHFQAGLVFGGAAHQRTDAAHRLHVVRNDFGPCLYDLCHELLSSLEVGNQHFDGRFRVETFDFTDGLRPMVCPQIGKVVTVHGGDNRVREFHQCDRLRHVCRFVGIQRQRLAACRIAELATAGTDVASNHEGSRTFPPALSHVGAAAAAANGVEAVRLHNPFRLGISFIGSDAYFEPFRFAYSHRIVEKLRIEN